MADFLIFILGFITAVVPLCLIYRVEKKESVRESCYQLWLRIRPFTFPRGSHLPLINEREERDQAFIQENQEITRKLADAREAANSWRQKYNDLVRCVGQDMAHTIAKDGTRTENISDRHRPSVLKERYSHLSFQRASDLKTQILKPDDMSKPEWTKFLNGLFCAIFMTSGDEMIRVHQKLLGYVRTYIHYPSLVDDKSGSIEANLEKEGVEFNNVDDAVNIYLRSQISPGQTQPMIKPVLNKVLQSVSTDGSQGVIQTCNLLRRVLDGGQNQPIWASRWIIFLQDVCDLSWQMSLQQPPMTFETPGISQPIDPDLQNVLPQHGNMSDSYSDRSLLVHYYMEPTLKHGDNVLEKGRVKTQSPETRYSTQKQ